MRLYLVPISTGRSLLYCKRVETQAAKQLSRIDKITDKASATWAKWEEAEGGWKKSLVLYGNRVLQRIPYEEWGLKSVPPLSTRRETEELKAHTPVDLVYPKNVIKESKVLALLRQLATERQTLSGSQHLCFLLDNNLINPTSLPALEQHYAQNPIPNSERITEIKDESPEADRQGENPVDGLLLKEPDGKKLAKILGPPELAMEVERAVGQVKHLLKEQKNA
ncbi:hypothetical protein FQN50_005190 [Emmonsiellopsis sp. PD_5]|nr:hypothetical protein FQN50_005190 [Emmonsiellopsis sp. PD_5]